MKRFTVWAALSSMIATQVPTQIRAVTIDMVTVGNPGNAPDTRYGGISVGSVAYAYQMGKYEITAGQYTEFLNAVAKADPNGLYSTQMATACCGVQGANIQRSGASPNFNYSVAADWADRPVNYVNFWDAARFANWLHNGQPTGAQGPGTTEGGAYHDVGNQALFGRNVGAKFFIPTLNEWYKAAYHDKPAGLAANYFDYPTGTNTLPGYDITETTDPGNNANRNHAGGDLYQRTVVGEFELSASPYGTFDQAGNIYEWNETPTGGTRGLRGGFFESSFGMHASTGNNTGPTDEHYSIGFRVGSIPEPSTAALIFCALFAIATFARGART